MRNRKCNTRKLNTAIYVIGEGATESYYCEHLKDIRKYTYKINKRHFRSHSITDMEKIIEEIIDAGTTVVCLINANVAQNDETEKKKLNKFIKRYIKKNNYYICKALLQ